MRVHWNTWGRVSQAQKRYWKEMMRFGAFVIFGGSNVDAGRFADESWQFQYACAIVFLPEIGADNHDVMMWCHKDLSCCKREGNIKGEQDQTSGAVHTVIWVFWYKAFGLVSKPQTLYLSCLGALWGGSITRMNIATYLSICMHPDLSEGLSVSMTSVVWQQLGRSLPSPLEPGIEQSTDHNPSVANCEGRINC